MFLNLEAILFRIFNNNLYVYKFHKFLNSYPKEDAIFQNPIYVWLASKNFTYFY